MFLNSVNQAQFTLKEEIQFDRRLIFPEDDFRMEYRGAVKENTMHGKGTLTLKSLKSYTGEWENNVFKDENARIKLLEFEEAWKADAKRAEEEK